jgi:hypothetical protein
MMVDDLKGTSHTVHLSPLAGRGRIALAIRVRGALRKRGGNGFKHACHVAQHVIVPETQHSIIVIGKPFVANGIARVISVLPVDLNYEPTVTADKVDRVRADRLLPHKLMAVQPARPEPIQERGFRTRGNPTQAPGTRSVLFSLAERMWKLPLTRIASQSDLSPHAGRG